MGLIEKIENFINTLLLKLGELIYKLLPTPVKKTHEKFIERKQNAVEFLKRVPSLLKPLIFNFIARAKSKASEYNLKAKLAETLEKAQTQYKERSNESLSRMKAFFLSPFFLLSEWLKGLSTMQSLLLMMFTGLSVLGVIGIGFSGQKLAKNHFDLGREPASVPEEDVKYERPEYYKKQTRFFEMTNLRLPVYIADVNELKSVDVDFTATMSNRSSKQYLEKNEFKLRDYLILQIEPSVATFPLTDEGREIIRRKILLEMNDFLSAQNIQGEVTDLKVTYVLAN